MQTKRWVRPLLAFVITFGIVAMTASVVRVVAFYQHLYSQGIQTDDPSVADKAARELSHMDQLYTPTFLAVALGVSGLCAVIFALWRPRAKTELPPPLPTGR